MAKNQFQLPKNPLWKKIVEQAACELLGDDWRLIAEQKTPASISVDWLNGGRQVEWNEFIADAISPGEKVLSVAMVDLSLGSTDFPRGMSMDSPGGVAAVREFYNNGYLKSLTHIPRLGKISDPAPEQPASEEFYKSGCLARTTYFKNGLRHNPATNAPADTLFYDKTGVVASIDHRHEGIAIDLANGIPGKIHYSEDGTPSRGCFADGTELHKADMTKLIANIRQQELDNLVSGETEIVALSSGSLARKSGNTEQAGKTPKRQGL